jgi:hypothetical protein
MARKGRPHRVVDSKALHERAVAAARAVEELCLGQPEARGKCAQAEAELLNRIKSEDEDCKSMVIDAWSYMQECGSTFEQEQQVIRPVLEARLHAQMAPEVAADSEMERILRGLKDNADVLYDYFEHTREPFLWTAQR